VLHCALHRQPGNLFSPTIYKYIAFVVLKMHFSVEHDISILEWFSISICRGPSWPYGSLIYNYLCNQCLSPLMLWVQISIMARCTTLCDKVCQWLATGQWLSQGPLVSSTNKTDHHDITEILLKVALNTIKQTFLFLVALAILEWWRSQLSDIFLKVDHPCRQWRQTTLEVKS
jgi:hypothetical protein